MLGEIDIKLQDLAKIALGTPQLTNVNVAILHSLIEILLKKLNCHDETVSLNASDGKKLENLLQAAQVSPIVFNDENVEKVSEKLQRLNKLQENVEKLEQILDRHLTETQRKSNSKDTVVDLANWPSKSCEHLCTTCDPENALACAILNNTDFLKKLQRRMAAPVIERLFHFEAKVEKLNEEFTKFTTRAKEVYFNVQMLEKCMEEIAKLREIIEEQRKCFLMTMEEIQDMLDSKLDKVHVPALKKYIRDNFQRIDQSINTLQDKQKCPRASGIIMDGLRCLSCGNADVCSEVGVQSASMLPDVLVKHVETKKYCGDVPDFTVDKKFAMTSWNLGDEVQIRRSEKIPKETASLRCRKRGEDFELLKSFDGKSYRKA